VKSEADQAPQWREDVTGRKPRTAWRWDQAQALRNNMPEENPSRCTARIEIRRFGLRKSLGSGPTLTPAGAARLDRSGS
jgi:hypothetical protein